MGIDRKAVKAAREAAEQAKADAELPKENRGERPVVGKKRLPGVLKHLRKVRNFVRRMQAGEDVDVVWEQMARDLRELNRARRKLLDVEGGQGWLETSPRNPETRAAAGEIDAMLSHDRDLATKLDHPSWADLDDVVKASSPGPEVWIDRDRILARAGDEFLGEFPDDETARRAADDRWEAIKADYPAGRRHGMTRWSKLMDAIEWFL